MEMHISQGSKKHRDAAAEALMEKCWLTALLMLSWKPPHSVGSRLIGTIYTI